MITSVSNLCLSDTISQIQGMNNTIDTIGHLVTVSNDTISNQIAAINLLLVVFSIIMALIGAGLGFYISKLHHKVLVIKENIDEKAYIWKPADGSSDRFVDGSGKQHAVALQSVWLGRSGRTVAGVQP